jgi:hypothetical protein
MPGCPLIAREPHTDAIPLPALGLMHSHPVVIATQSQLGLYTAVDLGLIPSHSPDLDNCVDWLWVIASQNLPARGCYWTLRYGWATAVLTG